MARKRMIDPDFWNDESLGMLDRTTRLLFMGLISQADDDGRLRGNPALIRAVIFPYDDDLSAKAVDQLLADLQQCGLIMRYACEGQQFIWIVNFAKHQTINKKTDSKLPPPPELQDDEQNTTTAPLPEDYGSATVALPLKRKEEKLKEEKLSGATNQDSPRKRTAANEMWDAFSHALGTEPKTSGERGKWNKAIKELLDAEITPEEVPRLVKAYRRIYQDIDCNPKAIANNLSAVTSRNGLHAPPKRDRDAEKAEFKAMLEEEEAKLEKAE